MSIFCLSEKYSIILSSANNDHKKNKNIYIIYMECCHWSNASHRALKLRTKISWQNVQFLNYQLKLASLSSYTSLTVIPNYQISLCVNSVWLETTFSFAHDDFGTLSTIPRYTVLSYIHQHILISCHGFL